MKQQIDHMEAVLSRAVSGFHQYALEEPVQLTYVSENLCAMTGYTAEELLCGGYTILVHEDDREDFSEALETLRKTEQPITLQYRLVKKDGTVLHVSDQMTVQRAADGTLMADSVLTDITGLKRENSDLRALDQTLPCGFLKYTCEKRPKVTYVNRHMLDLLHFPTGEVEDLDLYRDNLYMIIPVEERSRFARALERVMMQGTPVAGEITLLRYDGSRAHMFGWVSKHTNEEGKEEFLTVCIDITTRYRINKEKVTRRYVKALTDVYDKIFEYDFSSNTVKCLYWQNAVMFQWLQNIPMQMEEATEKWIMATVYEEDRRCARSFFLESCRETPGQTDAQPPQITYRERSPAGDLELHTGIFLKLDSSTSLFCCRRVTDSEEADLLRSENKSLKSMQELVMRFSEGIAAFEIRGSFATPLYASDNVCEFFGFTKEEWLPLMKKSTPIRELVSRCKVDYKNFAGLLENGEARFTYYDLNTDTHRAIRAICSEKMPDRESPYYVMLYNVSDGEETQKEDPTRTARVYIRTFGYFDVFVNDRPIAFRNEKAKELLALLVDRRGGYISSEEAIGFLWEEDSVDSVTQARYRKVALRLKNTLEEYGISDIVESVNGQRRIAADRIGCDLYDYLSGREEFANLFKGNYLTNYSWGETTLASLSGDLL